MPLVVVPLAPDELGALTVDEWDRLVACAHVLFERPDHPLVERLGAAGVACGAFDDEPDATRAGWGLVADPASPRVLDLARAGAVVTSGTARAPDSLSAAHAAPLVRRAGASLGALAVVMARLRSDDGCPWDREQSHASLARHLLSETYEVLEAIETGAVGPELEEELGDVLLQVAFHSRLAEQDGRFDLAAVADGIVAKLLHRHPHVFGDVEVGDAAEVLRNWEAIKAAEKRRADPFEGIPGSLPALVAATEAQKRAGARGFAVDAAAARRRAAAALERVEPDVGEALFWLVAVARAAGVDAEAALRAATRSFRERVASS